MRAQDPLGTIGRTPLVHLPRFSEASAGQIIVKHEGGNPTGSMKDRMALAMVDAARRDGRLQPGQAVVEFTGGSTGSSLALVCAVRGHPLHLVTADCFSDEKIATMRAFGANVEVLETPDGKVYPGLMARFREGVARLREEHGAYWTHQMENPDQLEGYRAMGEEMVNEAPDITDFVMSVGTGGCSMGVAGVLRARRPDARVTLVEPAESPYLSQGRGGSHQVEGIAVQASPPLLNKTLYDDILAVPEAEGRAAVRRVAREDGLFVGTSSGLNLAAAARVARARGPDAVVVTVGVDTGLKYLAGSLFAHDA